MTVQSTTQTTATTTTQYSTTQKTSSSHFEETLNQTQNSTQASTEASEASKEADFKNVERFSYEFIKNTSIEEIDTLYSDLSEEEVSKIKILHHISNMSENETLNQVIFDKASDMSTKEARGYYFQKASEQYHYKTTGTGQRFELNSNLYTLSSDGFVMKNKDSLVLHPDEYKLSHEDSFNFLVDMINSSKEGMNNQNYSDEIKKMYEEVFVEYSDLLEKYNSTLRQNLTGNV